MTVAQIGEVRASPGHDLPGTGGEPGARKRPSEGLAGFMPRRAGPRWQVLRAHVEDDVPLVALARHHGVRCGRCSGGTPPTNATVETV